MIGLKMKGFLRKSFTLLLMLLAGAQSAGLYTGSHNDDCDVLYDLALKILNGLDDIDEQYATIIRMWIVRVTKSDISDHAALKEFLCKVARVKSVRELHQLMTAIEPRYEVFLRHYQYLLQRDLARNDGYTGFPRQMKIAFEFGKWLYELPEGIKVSDRIDLANFTRFFEVMNVKYGSRWPLAAMIFFDSEFKAEMENPEKMAKTLYESQTQRYPGVTVIIHRKYTNLIPPFPEDFLETVLKGIVILGDMGLFTLEY